MHKNNWHGAFRTSVFRLSVRHLAFITLTLLAVLPTLALLRMAVLFFVKEKNSTLHSVELVALAIFATVCYAGGFHCLYAIVKRIKNLHRQSFSLCSDENFENAASAQAVSPLLPYDSEAEETTNPRVESSFNEFESLAATLTGIQAQLNRNLDKLQDQAFFLNQLEKMLDDSEDIAVICDADSNVLFSNRAARNILGVRPDNPIRYALQEGKLEAENIHRTIEILESRGNRTDELYFRNQAGDKMTFEAKCRITRDKHHEPSKIIVLRDISDRKRLERQLYRSEKLATLGQLISGVAHELNNPLAAILGFAELCRDSEQSRQQLDENLEVIEREARRTGHIVDNLLNFSRQRQNQRTVVDVHELLERCFKLLAYNFRNTGITISRDYDTTLPHIRMDEYQMQQVFMNLIVNSAQALNESETDRPEITVRTHLTRNDKQMVIELSDNGPGIPQEHRQQIFQAFFTTKPDGEGTGLGLPVSLGIVKEHGGTILHSSPRKSGACFKIILPVPDKTSAAASPKRQSTSCRQLSGRILAVDDEKSVLSMMCAALEKVGLEVITADSVKGASAEIARHDFDMALVDMYLEDGNGMDIWELIQDHQPQLVDKIIFMTGEPEVSKKIAARLGIDPPLLLKPFHMKDLYDTVRENLESRKNLKLTT